MKKTIITLLALSGIAAAATETETKQYSGDFAWGTGATPTLTLTNSPLTITLSTTEAYKNTSYLQGSFTPDSNVGNGDPWALSFVITNTGGTDITLTALEFGLFSFNAGGTTQSTYTDRSITLTLSGDLTGTTNYTVKGNADGSLANMSLTLANTPTIAAGESIRFNLDVARAATETLGTFVGLDSATLTTQVEVTQTETVPEPTTATLSLLALAALAARRRRR